ncbi:MAG: gamma-glutamyl-gamma-aminobutyrate hydrolase family protein, partial [Eubacteriales bacterium]|nr:gamma-glutamyl-gamma-aminobutyrate hydrolase family protein [Eubacteriales bacterium]
VKYTLNKNYLNIFKKSNIPYYISDYNTNLIEIHKICGILLTGGGDISEKYLNEPLHLKATDIYEERDNFEIQLLKEAYLNNIPTLGICRGAQIMNIAFGGTINQHIEGHLQKEDRNIPTHHITIEKDTEFYKIIEKDKIKVNSIHHQVIKDIAIGFKKIAFSEDENIEGIELINNTKYFLGVQWHPEALFDNNSKKIFESFLERVYNFN